jgi:hypothetical protein
MKPPALAFLASLIVLGVACGGDERAPRSAAPGGAAGPPDATYTVRGKVTALPRPGADPPELMVHHEPIPSFADSRGRVVGMDSMEMGFALGPGVALEGIAPGDPVEARLEMRWDAQPAGTLGMVRELPADTALELDR